jgi:hypothetical protein
MGDCEGCIYENYSTDWNGCINCFRHPNCMDRYEKREEVSAEEAEDERKMDEGAHDEKK